MLELAILGLLKDEELHGYELKRRLTDTLGAFSSVSFGSLYPALRKLEAAGAVKAVTAALHPDVTPLSTPATGSLGAELAAFKARRARADAAPTKATTATGKDARRRVYGITPKGEALFDEMVSVDPANLDDDREFGLRLALARFLPPEARVRLLERRRSSLIERLARAQTLRKAVTPARDPYATALADHGNEATAHDIAWLDRLLASEKAASTQTNPTAAHIPAQFINHDVLED